MDAPDRSSSRDPGRPEFPLPFGRYTLLGRLGTGGMADALLAMLQGAMGFQKPVVLKRMHASLGRDSHFVKMFLDEARLAARLGHANVVATSEVGECDGHYFIAMDYLEGVSLDRIARKYIHDGSEVPLGLLLRVLCDCLAGLHYAHELRDYDGAPLNVVHRDVTPSNLFVTSSGVAKVLDFGIAKATTQDEATRTGMLKGKLAYMSPEQFYDAPIDRRSDVWSMGVVVWEMVTGRRLFKGPNDAQTYRNIMNAEVPSVGTYRRDAPVDIDAVIARALARDREKRYASADEMRLGLERVLRERLGDTGHTEVATAVRTHFGDTLEDNRRAIREFARRRVTKEPEAPPPEEEDDDENPTEVGARTMAAENTRPSAIAPVVKREVPSSTAPVESAWHEDDDDDDPANSTVVDMKLPPSLSAIAASIPVRPATIPGVRAAGRPPPLTLPAAPQRVSTSLSPFNQPSVVEATTPAPPPATPLHFAPQVYGPQQASQGAPLFDPVPPEVAQARARGLRGERRRSAAVQALGWVTLLAILGALGAAVWSQRAFIERGARELVSGAPPDPARVGSFQLRIVSVPSGARVREGATDLGPAPIEISVLRANAADHPRQFTLSLDGYTTVTAVQANTLDPRAELRVTLTPVNPRAPQR